MRDFFTNPVVVCIIVIFGWLFMITTFLGKDDVSYQFKYSYTDNVGNTKVDTTITECIVFNSKEITLKEAQRLFMKDKPKVSKLSISDKCDVDFLGSPIHKRVRIPVKG